MYMTTERETWRGMRSDLFNKKQLMSGSAGVTKRNERIGLEKDIPSIHHHIPAYIWVYSY